MPIEIHPLTTHIGASMTGIDACQPLTAAEVDAINAGMDKYAVLVLPGQDISDEQQLAFTRNFGPLEEGANSTVRSSELRLDPAFVPAMVNLADLDRARGMDEQGAELLRKAMSIEPDNADVRHSLGLFLVRQHDYAGALDMLRRATELAPDNARYAYVYAVALNSRGAPADAMALLERAHHQHPTDREILMALVSIARDTGNFAVALRHARELGALDPGDARLRALVSELEKKPTR